jgi:hypothetical protein
MAYLLACKIALAVSVTVIEDVFDDQGNYLTPNTSQPIGVSIGSLLAPE